MTALTIDHLSGGRFRLGLGVSSPTVSEGWHGVAFERPLTRTREYVAIVREIVRRERPLEYRGQVFELPLNGGSRSRPLKSILHPLRPHLPIYLASIAPSGVELAAEIADGWIPAFYAPEHAHVFAEALERGLDRAGRTRSDLEIAPMVTVHVGDDLEQCRAIVKNALALYVGGMGSLKTNFYADLVRRFGYEDSVEVIQQLYLSGQREQAAQAVPDALVDEVALVGSPARIVERLRAWEASGVDTLIATTAQTEALHLLAETIS
jgi:F420-dependent oxidoreductase-like protein